MTYQKSLAGAALLAVVTTGAFAANVHFKPDSPSFIDDGTSLTAFGQLAGIGNVNLLITLTGTGTGECINPVTGEHIPMFDPTVDSILGVSEVKNGTVAFNITAQGHGHGHGAACNPSWNATLDFTSATLQVQQPVGTVVLSTTCTFTPPTTDGGVPSSSFTCTE